MSEPGPGVRSVAVAGPPLSGKTTCGRRAASLLALPFIDLDGLVESAAGATPADLIVREGEAAFRRIERRCLAEAMESDAPFLIALGGGALLDPGSLALVTSRTILLVLSVPDPVLISRLRSCPRPLAPDETAFSNLLEARRLHYISLPGRRIDCDSLGVADCSALIAGEAGRALCRG